MRRPVSYFMLLLGIIGCTPKAERVPIYRYINVLTGNHPVRLGEPFVAEGLAARVDDTMYQLLPGTFGGGGTTEIWAYTDSSTVLRRLEFYYDGSEPYEAKARDYTESLGSPQAITSGSDHQLLWQDSVTRFVLHLDSSRTKPIWSELADRLP